MHTHTRQQVFGQKTERGFTPLVLVPSVRSGNIFVVFVFLLLFPFKNTRFLHHHHHHHLLLLHKTHTKNSYHGSDSIVVENGKTVGIFKPGRYWRTHFWQISYVVSKQRIPYHFAVKSCPTKDNVRVDVYVDFLFHVHDSMSFVTRISAENMEELLRSTEAEAVRGRVRAVSSDQVLDLRGVNCDDMLTTLNDMLNPYGITVDRVTIASVHLPRIVTARLQNTTTFQSKQKLQEKRQELELRRMSGKQYYQANVSARANELTRVTEMAKKRRQVIQQEIDAVNERLSADIKRVEDEYYNRTQQLQADRVAEIDRIHRERDKQVADIRAAGETRVSTIRLEADKYEAAVRAETALKVAQTRARIAQIRAETERYVAQRMKERREFEVRERRVAALRGLAANSVTPICDAGCSASGGAAPSPITALLCSARATAQLGLKQK